MDKPANTRIIAQQFIHLDQVDSTNSLARRMAAQGAADGLVIISEEQTAGRGRRGRTFQSARGLGLYLSVLLRPQMSAEQLSELTPWTAVAVCDAIHSVCGVRPSIKWINDLVLNGKKVCGILTELDYSQGTVSPCVVIGIGINVSHCPEDFPAELRPIATSLAHELARPVSRDALALEVIQRLDQMYSGFPSQKQEYLDKFRCDCLTPGNPVQLITPGCVREAFATGIDDNFHLLARLSDGTMHTVSSGEVSVRGMYGYL